MHKRPITRYLNIRNASIPVFREEGSELAFISNLTGNPLAWQCQSKLKNKLVAYSAVADFLGQHVQNKA